MLGAFARLGVAEVELLVAAANDDLDGVDAAGLVVLVGAGEPEHRGVVLRGAELANRLEHQAARGPFELDRLAAHVHLDLPVHAAAAPILHGAAELGQRRLGDDAQVGHPIDVHVQVLQLLRERHGSGSERWLGTGRGKGGAR